jgi:serine/threonine protein kinase
MSSEAPIPNQLGKYDVISKIAEGGMGSVHKGRNRETGEIVAIKVIAPATAKNPVLLQRFEREFQTTKLLNHPNVVKALDYSGAPPHPYIVMEFVDGQSIGQRLEQKGAYIEAEAVKLISQVCDGLQSAHKQGLVHRDIKPDNILVTRDGVAKITDMGLVKEVEGDLNLTRTGRGLGTPHYMAPEQFRNAKTVDVRGDIYSLGATLYAMVTGVIPFDNASPLDCWMKKIRNEFPTPKELNPAISERVDWAIRRAMSAEPGQRPSSCREFVEDLTGQSRNAPQTTAAVPALPADVWYLVYRDENNQPHTVKGSTESIRKALRDRLLGDPTGIVVSRTKHGQFTPIQSTAEFRDLAPVARPSGTDATVDYQALPTTHGASNSAIARGRPAPPPAVPQQPPSGQFAGQPKRPVPPPPPAPTPAPVPPSGKYAGPRPGTPLHPPQPEPADTETPAPRRRKPEPKSFNWVPVLVGLVAVLSVAIIYLLVAK